MKFKIYTILCSILLLQLNFVFGQDAPYECMLDKHLIGKRLQKPSKPQNLTICADDEITYLKVNFHFFLRLDGSGNFTETDDGNGNTGYTGYDYAKQLLKNMNDNMAKNYQAGLYPGNNPPAILPKQIQYVSKGIYFHRVADEIYNAYHLDPTVSIQWDIIGDFGANVGEEVNIFLMETVEDNVPEENQTVGVTPAFDIGQARMFLGNAWANYIEEIANNGSGSGYSYARVANHEMAHLLGNYHHTFECGNPCDNIDVNQTAETCGFGCDACWTSGGNNLLGYVPVQNTLTPCQINIMHNKLPDFSDYVELCCDDWTLEDISCCNNLPGIKMVSECYVEPCCDFNIEIDETYCDKSVNINSDKAVAPCFCFGLTGIGIGSTCNDWTISKLDPNTGLTVHESYFSDVDRVKYCPPPTGLTPYEVCVTLCNNACGEFTKCKLFSPPDYTNLTSGSIANTLSIGENFIPDNSVSGLNVYPNPTSSILNINFSDKQITKLSIFDISGREILLSLPQNESKSTINTESFNAGLYFLLVETIDSVEESTYFIKN